jgi:hypothetical protein
LRFTILEGIQAYKKASIATGTVAK